MLLASLFRQIVKAGTLDLVDAHGQKSRFGNGPPHLTLRLHDKAVEREILLNPRLRFGEAYMDGRITVEGGDIYDMLMLLSQGPDAQGPIGQIEVALRPLLRWVQQNNPLQRSRTNVAHHYDLNRRFYELFLDRDMQYSCAYFPSPTTSLDDAQLAKKRHILSKLLLEPDMRVLDIGCGWGGTAIQIASETGASVLGITLSQEQLTVARERATQAGLAGRVQFELMDYRSVTGTFDRIVSIGMFEHVGTPHYNTFFTRVRDILASDGVALLHSIGRSDGPWVTNPWIRKYIFPGGYSPALSEITPAIEKSGLFTADIEVLRLHYALTLRHWRQRFLARWHEAAAIYDERFCRMWEFYLAGCEMAFRLQGHVVFQIQLSKRLETVPLTRDYMIDRERKPFQQPGAVA